MIFVLGFLFGFVYSLIGGFMAGSAMDLPGVQPWHMVIAVLFWPFVLLAVVSILAFGDRRK